MVITPRAALSSGWTDSCSRRNLSGLFSCDALKRVRIPGHRQPPPNDLSRGVNSTLSPRWAVQMERLETRFQRFPFTVKIKAEMAILNFSNTLEDQGADKPIYYTF